MNKTFVVLFVVLFRITTYSQNVGINATGAAPDASAMLDVSSNNKGLLVPNVALTATNAAGPITSPATSLLVYNTATAGTAPNNVTPGYYYWNGASWLRLVSGSDYIQFPIGYYGTAGNYTNNRSILVSSAQNWWYFNNAPGTALADYILATGSIYTAESTTSVVKAEGWCYSSTVGAATYTAHLYKYSKNMSCGTNNLITATPTQTGTFLGSCTVTMTSTDYSGGWSIDLSSNPPVLSPGEILVLFIRNTSGAGRTMWGTGTITLKK